MPFRTSIQLNKKHNEGSRAEHLAKAYLSKKGYYVFTKDFGPIDIIAFDPKTEHTIYVDVKAVSYRSDGSIISRSRPKKLGKIIIDILNVDMKKNKIWFRPYKRGKTPPKDNLI